MENGEKATEDPQKQDDKDDIPKQEDGSAESHPYMDPGADEWDELSKEIMARHFRPTLITLQAWEGYKFAGIDIKISESNDLYGAVLWPSAMVLCHFLDAHREEHNLVDKNIIELGAGTGLVSIVTSLLGAKVTSTDLPEILGNLRYNVNRATRNVCRHPPNVMELSWGKDLEKRFPQASTHFDYIMAADVVYGHPFLDELMETFDHLCGDDTIILWAMRFRLDKENRFVGRFQKLFHLTELYNLPGLKIKLYSATRKFPRS